MNYPVQDEMRAQLAEALPKALAKAIDTYLEMMEAEWGCADMKDFKARHDAGKAALAHVELLIKMARLADIPVQAADDAQEEDLRALIAQADAEIAGSDI